MVGRERGLAEAKPYHLILLAENKKQYKNLTTSDLKT